MNTMNSKIFLSLLLLGIKRYKWISLLSFIIILAPSIVVGLKKKPVYESSATVYIKQNNYSTSNLDNHIHPPRSLGIEIAILKSNYLAEQVVQSLPQSTLQDLEKNAEFKDYKLKVINLMRTAIHESPVVVNPTEKAVMELRNARMTFGGGDAGIIKIGGESNSPDVARDLVNAYIDVFKRLSSRFTVEQQADLDKSLSLQIMNAQSLLRKSQNDLLSFQGHTHVKDSGHNIDVANYLSKEAMLLSGLRSRKSSLLLEETESHPDVILVNQQIQEIEKKVQKLKRISSPRGTGGGGSDISSGDWESFLESNVRMDQEMLKELEQERGSERIISDSNLENLIVIDPPTLPTVPTVTNGLKAIAGGVFMAIAGAVGIPFLILFLKKPVQGEDHLKKIMSLPVLAGIPKVPTKAIPIRSGSRILRVDQKDPAPELLDFQRSFERLYFRIKQLAKLEGKKIFLFTSPSPGEGKSTTLINVALTMASWGQKTIIIDADSIRGEIAKTLPLQNSFTLEESFNSQNGSVPRIIWDETNLASITLGKSGQNFLRNTTENSIRQWIEALHFQSDFILIDAPPLMLSNDLFGLFSVIDDTIVVVRNKITMESDLENLIAFIRDHDFKIAGSVLNESDPNPGYYDYAYNSKGAR